jgi:hypothetical protein
MANIFNKLTDAFVKAQAKRLAKQAVASLDALPIETSIDNATDVVCALIKAKSGFSVPEIADNFIDGLLIKLVNNAKLHVIEMIEKKIG